MLFRSYTFLSGAIALDMGGRRGSSTAAGLADGVGYLAGMLSGYGVGQVAQSQSWDVVFDGLFTASWLTSLAGLLYWFATRKPVQAAS